MFIDVEYDGDHEDFVIVCNVVLRTVLEMGFRRVVNQDPTWMLWNHLPSSWTEFIHVKTKTHLCVKGGEEQRERGVVRFSFHFFPTQGEAQSQSFSKDFARRALHMRKAISDITKTEHRASQGS